MKSYCSDSGVDTHNNLSHSIVDMVTVRNIEHHTKATVILLVKERRQPPHYGRWNHCEKQSLTTDTNADAISAIDDECRE